MQVIRLEIRDLRCLSLVQLELEPGLNLLTGANGSGKTSVLEALHLMAYGRSFRGRVRDGLVRAGSPALEVFVEWRETSGQGRIRRAGLRHGGQSWTGRLDGSDLDQLGDLCAALAVVTFEPGSHALVTGAAEQRRRFLDWGLFHVEPEFLGLWRRYSRALKQRNALLKARGQAAQLDAWEQELVRFAEPLTLHRERYLEQLRSHVQETGRALLPEAGEWSLQFQPGWRQDELSLADALLLARDRDLAAGFTSVGPHRADWRILQSGIPGRDALSRGQAKLTALAALLAQAEHQAAARREWPVVALDDLASELDREHQSLVLQRLAGYGAQVVMTGTEPPAGLPAGLPVTMFHVEHRTIRPSAGS
jgi:DNA replication and repair protein RecF